MDLNSSSLASRSRLSTVNDVRRALNPLQEHADRVGRHAEKFAENLDRLNPVDDEANTGVTAVLPLIQEYERIARETVKTLKRRHGDERRQLLKQARRRLDNTRAGALIQRPDYEDEDEPRTGTTVNDLVHWEEEQQTWDLLNSVLQLHDIVGQSSEQARFTPLERPTKTLVHRYSPDAAVYNNYLASDDAAWEKHVITQWLGRVNDSAEEDVFEVVEDVVDAKGETEALTAAGWIQTKETIKQQKRLRSWNRPLDPDSNETETMFGKSGQSKPLVTQLDPDAPTRQKRNLSDDDLVFERATWMGCWELLKRGRTWPEVLEWCKDRGEQWRAVSLRPSQIFQLETSSAGGSLQGRAYWQQTCLQLASAGGVDNYERAVYGLFGGNTKSVFGVCKTWNDYIYGFLSCELARRYNVFFCDHFKLPQALSKNGSAAPHSSLKHFVEDLSTKQELQGDMRSTLTMLQSSVMTGEIASFLSGQGAQLSSSLQKMRYGSRGNKDNLGTGQDLRNTTSSLTPGQHDVVRILAHLAIIYSSINPALTNNYAAENLIVAYIDFLGKAGKQQLLPIYASRLSKDRASSCMARQLIYIKDTTERQTILRLMKQYDLEYEIILFDQLETIIADAPPQPQYKDDFPKLTLLRSGRDQDVPQLKRNFMGSTIQDWEADLIDALEWFLLLEKHWNETFNAGTIVYKHFLRTGSWAAARELAHRISFSRISRMKTPKLLGSEFDLSKALLNGDDWNHDYMDEDANGFEENGPSLAVRREQLQKSSRTFQDLENFVLALDALDNWEQVFHASLPARRQAVDGDKFALKEWQREFQDAHDAVAEAMQPMLHGWLMLPKDEDEAVEASQIRKSVLPELILAYLSTHHVVGHFLHRESLLQSMNVARLIAEPSNSDLCEVFVEAGRMAELVELLSSLSLGIIKADESRTSKPTVSKKRRGDGETLDIWTIGGHSEEGQQVSLLQSQEQQQLEA